MIFTTTIFLAVLTIYSIDQSIIKNFINEAWKLRQGYVTLKINNSNNGSNGSNLSLSTSSITAPVLNSTTPENFAKLLPDPLPPPSPITPLKLRWISVKLEPNFTANLLSRWLTPGNEAKTVNISVPGLDNEKGLVKELRTGSIHEFVFHALDESGNPIHLGGDYFETDLSGESWKSRPPVKDYGNGSYSLSLQIHPDFAGYFNLTIILLFRHFEGLKFSPERFAFDKQLRKISLKFYRDDTVSLPELRTCENLENDFNKREIWSGRWTRHGRNNSCQISDDGRYRCLSSDYPCRDPWCTGPLGLLESNGWVYSAHCSFRIFSPQSGWDCLNNRWIFFWGDSNHVDTVRNILNLVLGPLPENVQVTRRFDRNFTNPRNRSQTIRITSVFNGHWDDSHNYLGLDSLKNQGFRELLMNYFSGPTIPDTMIMNSGLHDGVYWPNIRRFVSGAEYAASFWAEVLESVKKRGVVVPRFIYRTTVSTGGYARRLAYNPNKMEAFNEVFLEKLRHAGVLAGVIDDFDMTFPWHYDNRCNDGVHYGRAPAKLKWRDGEVGHQYFVDLMLAHILLNVLCIR